MKCDMNNSRIYLNNDLNLDIQTISTILSANNETLSVAESITAGHIQSILSSISGASSFFVGGITAYGLKSKVNILCVNEELATRTNCVSQEVADQMSLGAIEIFQSDYCISTCGYAEKYLSENIEKPLVYISIYKNNLNSTKCIYQGKKYLTGSRIEAQSMASYIALNEFIKCIKDG